MNFSCSKRWLAVGGSAMLLAAGVAATHHRTLPTSAPNAIPVVFTENSPPPVSDAEATRAIASAKDLSTAFRVAAARVLPALVTIETTAKEAEKPKDTDPDSRSRRRNPFEGTPFEDMFKDAPFGEDLPFGMQPEGRQQEGVGSGVIIDASGLIMTNSHVVGGGKNANVLVRLSDGREFKATDVRTDPKTDIAIVRIAGAEGLVAAQLADSDTISVGDWVLALGQPFGLESTVTAGIISATRRGVGINARESFLQTDAAINPGNSGGPLVDLDGKVVGINTAISSRGGGNDGVGFAVPVNIAKWVGDQLATTGNVRRAYLGIAIQQVTAREARVFGVRPREGVLVGEVFPNTPAAKAGVKQGDVIVRFAGIKVASPRELQLIVERSDLGQPHELVVVRDKEQTTLTFIPEEQPSNFGEVARNDNSPEPSVRAESLELAVVGLKISELTPAVARQLEMPGIRGVVVTSVKAGSPAERAGIKAGVVISQINRQDVTSVKDCENAIKDYQPEEGVLLLIRTPQGSRFVVINGS
ncbi:MAG: Do family serine endopeptidase [Planctomycetota bacterium]|nr:Do family serine endopeptidase [Planctomycetota bacterium]MDA1178397.1 Do family serine endopeptidase [Planctomycetota bacterium]